MRLDELLTMIPRNAPCPCGSGKKVKHCCRTVVRNATDLAAVLLDRGLPEARCYAMVRLGKWSNLTADELLQAMAWEAEFEASESKCELMDLAIKERQ